MDTQLELLKEKWDKILESIRDDNELSNVAFKTWLLPESVPYRRQYTEDHSTI